MTLVVVIPHGLSAYEAGNMMAAIHRAGFLVGVRR